MANKKEYNGQIVQAEFDKISLAKQLENYRLLGEWLHNKVVAHQEALGKELNHFESEKLSLKASKPIN